MNKNVHSRARQYVTTTKPLIVGLLFTVLVLLTLLVAFSYLTNIRVNHEDLHFVDVIAMRLKQPGDTVMVSEVYPGNWAMVCIVLPDSIAPGAAEVAAYALNVSPSNITIENTGAVYSNEAAWGLVFLYPPNKATYYRIPTNRFPYRSGDCAQRAAAALELTPATLPHRDGLPGIRLIDAHNKPRKDISRDNH